jgi:prophage antirepressor-like protein
MNAIQNFAFEDHLVRVVEQDDELWFVGKDVCAALNISKYRDALATLDDDEGRPVLVDTLGGQQEMAGVSEPGVYRLVFRSRKPEAERFKRWLAHEVLPAIRKTGSYGQPKPETIERIPLENEAPLMARVEAVKLASRLWGRDRARSLWSKLGLPAVPPSNQFESTGEARECLRHLLEHCPAQDDRTVRELILDAMDGHEEARLLCGSVGVRPCDDGTGYMVANVNHGLANVYKDTPWHRNKWRMVLKRLTGANPTGTIRFSPQSVQSRATWLPVSTLDEGES